MTQADDARTTVIDVAVFVAELVMLAVLAVAGARLAPATKARVALAIALPVVAAVVWGRWLAPRAPHRLTATPGLAAKVAVFTVAAVLLAVAGPVVWALGFWVVTVPLLLVAGRRADPGVSRV